ncbi:MobA/MobL family protein [Bacillus safensis]|uniref:MobA/MobL protein domain-containing protein n=1 Tax=Bacillus safensis TaxID=561879 RepID=A0A1L6ZPD0_BACIA|nr:MobA/MobL family protein [Bacillus safensis]APT48384.1 hypothetical protein BSA145_21210 [Bacillus safensis]
MTFAGEKKGYYRLEVKIFNRNKHSVVASASYRSDQDLYSERDGETKSFRKHKVKPESFIMKPNHAPEWALDRNRLWNEVEKIEKNQNAQLAREVLLSIPKEFTDEQQRKLVEEFVLDQFVNNGMVADVSIHRDDENNPHAHVMLTMRPFKENGDWDSKSKRIQKFDSMGNPMFNQKGQRMTVSVKTTDWNSPEKLLEWRNNWAEYLNEHSKNNKIDLKFSSRSFGDQGFNKMPLLSLSRSEYYVEKKEKELAERAGISYKPKTYYAKQNELIKKYNSLLEKEDTTLEQITKMKDEIPSDNQIKVRNLIVQFDKENPLKDSEKSSYKFVKKRAKEDVDFAVARKIYIDIKEGNIFKKINSLQVKLDSMKHFINNVLKSEYNFDKGISFSNSFELNNGEFNNYVNKKMEEYKELDKQLNTLINVREQSLYEAEIVLKRETEKVNYAFENTFSDDIINEKFKSPTLRYSALQSILIDDIKPNINKNYKTQNSIKKHYDKLERIGSLKDQFILINNHMNRSLLAYRYHDKNINKWIKHKSGLSDIPINAGTHLISLENRELARKSTLQYREQLDELLPNVIEKYNLDEDLSLRQVAEIMSGSDVSNISLYGEKDKIFYKEKDSQSNDYQLKENEDYGHDIDDYNDPSKFKSNSDQIASSILDGLFTADNDHNYYKNKKKLKKKKGKYYTVDDNEFQK